ncbi:hypothetical protein CBOM_06981 [Ceraceosorus bombacis]|uniref:Uncharacterized protein n=1 Tax=Ceraceosorus bombacis TaxID=401625 RepID=A0A0P1BKX2_9BASI|nr:hypothetical protein CBOM_06981 [Ceraceosorus bombacis]
MRLSVIFGFVFSAITLTSVVAAPLEDQPKLVHKVSDGPKLFKVAKDQSDLGDFWLEQSKQDFGVACAEKVRDTSDGLLTYENYVILPPAFNVNVHGEKLDEQKFVIQASCKYTLDVSGTRLPWTSTEITDKVAKSLHWDSLPTKVPA